MDEVEQGGDGLAEVFAMLRYRATMILTFVGLSFCIALALLMVIPPRYTATTSILLDPMTTTGLRVAGGEFSSSPVDAAKIASITAIIQSSEFLDQVVKAERLIEDPEFVGGPRNILVRWLRFVTGNAEESPTDAQLVAKAEESLLKSVKVARDSMTYVINIDVVSTSPAKAKALVTRIADLYVRNRVEARIISPPRLPDTPSFPRPKSFILVALGIGLLVGAVIAFLLERSANSVSTPEQVERIFKLPVLAPVPMLTDEELGHGPKRHGVTDYVAKHPFSQFAESLRTIRFGLRQDPKHICRIVQFASPMPNEGKSTLAASVALSFAMDGIRTILIDCDLRHSFSSDTFRVRNAQGVADYLMGLASFEDVLTPTSEHFLHVIPPGKVTRSPPDLANSRRLQNLVQAASAVADFVIVDSPAMEVAVDAAIISQIVDATIIVAKWRSSDRALVARSIEHIQRAQGRIAGVVLNGIDLKTAVYWGYWNKDYVRKTSEYYAAAEARGRAVQAARDAL
jgi:capsular exopolysaccharide synthesis family protein